MDGFRVTLHTEVQWCIWCDKGGEIHVSSASIGCQRCPHRRPAGERLFGFARHFGLSSNNNDDDDDDRDNDSKPVSETCPGTYELLVRWMGVDAAKSVRQGDLRRPLRVECAARCASEPVGFAGGLGAWTLCHRCVNVFHRRCFERCRRCPVCSEPTPAASFGSAGLQPDMADDDDTPAPPAKRQRVEPEVAPPAVDDDASQPMDVTADDLERHLALTDAEQRRVRAEIERRLDLGADEDGREPVLVRAVPPAVDAATAATCLLGLPDLRELAPPGVHVKWAVDFAGGRELRLVPLAYGGGGSHAGGNANITKQLGNWCDTDSTVSLLAYNAEREDGTFGAKAMRPDNGVRPAVGESTGTDKERERAVVELETMHRDPRKMRVDYTNYFRDSESSAGELTRIVVGIKVYPTRTHYFSAPASNDWEAVAVVWERSDDNTIAVTQAVDFGRVALSESQRRLFETPSAGTGELPPVTCAWTRCSVRPPNDWPSKAPPPDDAWATPPPQVRLAAKALLHKINMPPDFEMPRDMTLRLDHVLSAVFRTRSYYVRRSPAAAATT